MNLFCQRRWLLGCLLVISLPNALIHAQQTAVPDQRSQDVSLTRTRLAPIALKSSAADPRGQDAQAADSPFTSTHAGSTITVVSSLAIVLSLFGAFVWVSKKANQGHGRNRVVPDEALSILGQKSLGPQSSIALVRCGSSLLIVGMHSGGMSRLGEIQDEHQIRHLEALCKGESKASFNDTLAEIQREPIKRGFIGEEIQSVASGSRRPLFG